MSGPGTVDGSCLSEATSAHCSRTFSAPDKFDDRLPASLAVQKMFGGREVGHSYFKLQFDESYYGLRGLEIL